MASDPRRISKIEVQFTFPENYEDKTKKKLEKAALTCPVLQSLHPILKRYSVYISFLTKRHVHHI